MHSRGVLSVAFVVALGIVALAAAGMDAAVRHYKLELVKLPIYAKEGRLLSSVPFETASWICRGGDRRESAEVETTLGTKNYITRDYVSKEPMLGKKSIALQLHAAYYTGMIDTVPHVADRCFVAGGMQLGTLTQDLPLPLDHSRMIPDTDVPEHLMGRIFRIRPEDGVKERLPRDPKAIKIHTMRFDNQGQDLYAGYFFVANGGTVARAEDVRLLAFDLRNKYAFYIKLQFTSTDVTSQEELAQAAASLLDELFGDIMRCTPDWVEVEAGRYPEPAEIGAKD